jgi:hypothetical protein
MQGLTEQTVGPYEVIEGGYQSRFGNRIPMSFCAVTWKTPGGLPFPMPLEVLVGDRIVVLEMTGNRGEFERPAGATVTFDPHSKILRQSDAIDELQGWRADQPAEDE